MPLHSSFRANLFNDMRAADAFRQVLATTRHIQLVIMTIPPGGEIGAEVHEGVDQMLIAIEGDGISSIDGVEAVFAAGDVAIVPEGTPHNFVNNGEVPLRLVSVYGPPEHPENTMHLTKEEADDLHA